MGLPERYWEPVRKVLQSLISLALGFAAGGVLLYLSGYDPLMAYRAMFLGDPSRGVQGAFGGMFGLVSTLREASFLILTGLAVAVSFIAGMFNIGVEGAMYVGAFTAFLVGYTVALPWPLHVVASIACAMAAGAAWLYVPAVLKVRRGAHEVVTTIMMNYIAILLTEMLVLRVFLPRTGIPPGGILTPPVAETAVVRPIPLPHRGRLELSFPVAVATALLVHLVIRGTPLGYEMRATGLNPRAAEYGGIDVPRILVLSMVMSGALSGLAGACDVNFVEFRFNRFFSPGYGFDGIAVSLIGKLEPLGVLLAAMFVAALHVGARSLQPALGMPKELAIAIEGLIIFFAALPGLLDMAVAWYRRRRVRG